MKHHFKTTKPHVCRLEAHLNVLNARQNFLSLSVLSISVCKELGREEFMTANRISVRFQSYSSLFE